MHFISLKQYVWSDVIIDTRPPPPALQVTGDDHRDRSGGTPGQECHLAVEAGCAGFHYLVPSRPRLSGCRWVETAAAERLLSQGQQDGCEAEGEARLHPPPADGAVGTDAPDTITHWLNNPIS